MKNFFSIISITLIYIYIYVIDYGQEFDIVQYILFLSFFYLFIFLFDRLFDFGFLNELKPFFKWIPVFKTRDANTLWFGGLALILLIIGFGISNDLEKETFEVDIRGVLFFPIMIGVFYILAKYIDKK